jgi:hypothetical protein
LVPVVGLKKSNLSRWHQGFSLHLSGCLTPKSHWPIGRRFQHEKLLMWGVLEIYTLNEMILGYWLISAE